jgi:hypothetical protein
MQLRYDLIRGYRIEVGEMFPGEPKIQASHRSGDRGRRFGASQNQAMDALSYKRAMRKRLTRSTEVVRVDQRIGVLGMEEVASVRTLMTGTPHFDERLFGSSLRVPEALPGRIKDIDFLGRH